MTETVFALFETPMDVRRAIKALSEAAVCSRAITVCSTEPARNHAFLPPEGPRTRIPMFALAGGALGFAAGYLLPAVTAGMMDLPTGGQPIVSLWAFAIVVFELMVLGAIAGMVLTLLYETSLPRLGGRGYDDELAHELARGRWLIRVTASQPEKVEEVSRLMYETGATRVKTV